MTAKDLLYDTTVDLELLIDEARAILDHCTLPEDHKAEFESMIVATEARCETYREACDSEHAKFDELHTQARIDLESLSEEIMEWSEVVKHQDLIVAINAQVEELEMLRSQAQDIINQGELPAMYYPGLEDMMDDIGSRIEEYAALPGKAPIDSIQALGELATAMIIFSDSMDHYKQLADPESNPEE